MRIGSELSLPLFVATAALLAAAPSASAGTININFTCNGLALNNGGTGLYAGAGNLCSTTATGTSANKYGPASGNSIANENNFASWTQPGLVPAFPFTVASTGFVWNAQNGVPNNNNEAPQGGIPSLTGGLPIGSSYTTSVVTVTDDGAPFIFGSVDILGSGFGGQTKIQGFNGTPQTTPLFTISESTIGSEVNTSTYSEVTGNSAHITTLVITLSSGGIDRLDNIDVTPTPEPTSLLLLGTGLLGLGAVVRRKVRA